MSCERNANKTASAATANGVAKTVAKTAYHRRFSWRGHAGTLRRAVKAWRSERDDATLLAARTTVTRALVKQALATVAGNHPAGIARNIAAERTRLLLYPPRSLSVAERTERLAALDAALVQLRREKRLSERAFRYAVIDAVCAENDRPSRSSLPVRWLPRRPVGAETVAVNPGDPTQKISARFRVVDLSEPVVSNLPSGAINPAYDQALQPRRRDRAASTLQIDRLSRTLSPTALLNADARWDDGPPIVGPDGMVESGNGRTLALRHAAENNPQQYRAYRAALLDAAPTLGFDRAEIESISTPLLVRERLTDFSPAQRRRFIRTANSSAAARMGSAEQARADAELIPSGFFADLQVADSDTSLAETLGKKANLPVVARFLRLLPETERAALLDKRGRLSATGMQRIERAMFVYALPGGSGERLSRLVYESGEAIDRIGAGLKRALPKLGQLEDRIRAGTLAPDLQIGGDIAVAVEKLRDLRKQGLRVNDYLRQQQILPDLTPFQAQLLVQLDARRKSARAVAEFFNAYATAALKTPPPQQLSLVDTPPVTGLLRAAVEQSGGTWVDMSRWSDAQYAIAGFDMPLTQIETLDRDQQRLGMLVAANN